MREPLPVAVAILLLAPPYLWFWAQAIADLAAALLREPRPPRQAGR